MQDVPTIVILVSLAAGYVCQTMLLYTRFRAEAFSWDRRIFEAGAIGGVLFAFARLIVTSLHCLVPKASARLAETVHTSLPFHYSGTLLTTLICAFIIPLLANCFSSPSQAVQAANRSYGGAFRSLLADSIYHSKQITVVMDTRVVYIGFVTQTPGFSSFNSYLKLLVTAVGVMPEGTSLYEFESNYAEKIEERLQGDGESSEADHFVVSLPLERVASIQNFDPDIPLRIANSMEDGPSDST